MLRTDWVDVWVCVCLLWCCIVVKLGKLAFTFLARLSLWSTFGTAWEQHFRDRLHRDDNWTWSPPQHPSLLPSSSSEAHVGGEGKVVGEGDVGAEKFSRRGLSRRLISINITLLMVFFSSFSSLCGYSWAVYVRSKIRLQCIYWILDFLLQKYQNLWFSIRGNVVDIQESTSTVYTTLHPGLSSTQ